MILTAIKQTTALLYWLILAVLLQIDQPQMPILYAFAGAIGLGLMITVVWVISPLISARMYRERITDLEQRLRALECKYDKLTAENAELQRINGEHARYLEDAYDYIRRLEAKYAGQNFDS